jgi:hypothetical protein
MRHLGSLLASIAITPVAWVLLAFGQSGMHAHWDPAGPSTAWPEKVAALTAAGLLLGLLASTRISPFGPLVAGLAYAGFGYGALLHKQSYDLLPGTLTLAGRRADLHAPVDNGTAIAVGVLLLVAVLSVRRWQRWPKRQPAGAVPVADDVTGEPALVYEPERAYEPEPARAYHPEPAMAPRAASEPVTQRLPEPVVPDWAGPAPTGSERLDQESVTQPVRSPEPVHSPEHSPEPVTERLPQPAAGHAPDPEATQPVVGGTPPAPRPSPEAGRVADAGPAAGAASHGEPGPGSEGQPTPDGPGQQRPPASSPWSAPPGQSPR